MKLNFETFFFSNKKYNKQTEDLLVRHEGYNPHNVRNSRSHERQESLLSV